MKNKFYLSSSLIIVALLLLAGVSLKKDFAMMGKGNTAAVIKSMDTSVKSSDNTQTQYLFSKIKFLDLEVKESIASYKVATTSKSRTEIDVGLIQKIKERKIVAKNLMKADPLLFLSLAIPSKTRTSLPVSVQNDVEVEKTISGVVDVIHVDDFKNPKNSHYEYFLTENGKRYNLHVVGELGIKSNTHIEARGYVLDDVMVISTNNRNVKVSLNRQPKDGGTLDSVGNQRTLVLLIKSFPGDSEPFTATQGQNLVFNGQFQNFMREQSYDRVSFSGDVYGWTALNREVNNGCTFLEDGELLAVINVYNINLNNYDRIVFAHKDASGGCSMVGKSDFVLDNATYFISRTSIGLMGYDSPSWWGGQPFIWTNLDYLLAHELGHALGVVHANSWTCTDNEILYSSNCWHNEYGNYFDTMGSISHSLNFNAYFKEQLGWISNEQILNINQSGSYMITPLELKTGNKFAKINIPGSTSTPYFVEFRKAIGFDTNLNNPRLIQNQNGVFINRIQKSWAPETELLDMSPESSNGNNTENVTLNLQSSNTSVSSFSDPGTGITIGPVSNVSSSSVSFDVNFQSPICRRLAPIINLSNYQAYMAAGTSGHLNLNIFNQDYYGCGDSSDFNIRISSTSPNQWQYEVSPSGGITIAQNATGYMSVQFNVPLNTPTGYQLLGIDIVNTTGDQVRHIDLEVYVVPPLVITSVEPTHGLPGTVIILNGTGFSDDFDNRVYISDSKNLTSDIEYLNSSNGSILFTIPNTIKRNNDDGSFSVIPTPEGDYKINLSVKNSYTQTDFHVGANLPVVPSASFIGASTLQMFYDTESGTGNEDKIVSKYLLRINSGNEEQTISKNWAVNPALRTKSGLYVSQESTVYTPLTNLNVDKSGEFYIIPANTTVDFTVKTSFNPKKMFAGVYYGKLEQVTLGEYPNQKWINIPEPNTTNLLTVIGERSPYINSISATTTPSNQEITISGVRFEGSEDSLKMANRDGTIYSRRIQIIDSGQTIKLTPNVPEGDYYITIEHPKTGGSNGVSLNVTVPLAPSILSWTGPNTVISSSTLTYTLNWEGRSTSKEHTIFVHFVDPSGNTRFLNSFIPTPKTTEWSGPISTQISVAVPSNTPVGTYKVMAGLYNPTTGVRMPLIPGDGVTIDNQTRYQVGTLNIVSSSRPISISRWTGPLAISASSTLSYSLNWQGGPTDTDQRIFVHFVDPSGNTRFLNSVVPNPRTTNWSSTTTIPITVSVPSNVPLGPYRVMAGLYNPVTGVRTVLTPDVGVTVDNQNRYQVGTIGVLGPNALPRLVSCIPDIATTTVGSTVVWNAIATGGVSPLHYYWSDVKDVVESSDNGRISRTYNTIGKKYMGIAIIDSANNRTDWAFCPGTVNVIEGSTIRSTGGGSTRFTPIQEEIVSPTPESAPEPVQQMIPNNDSEQEAAPPAETTIKRTNSLSATILNSILRLFGF